MKSQRHAILLALGFLSFSVAAYATNPDGPAKENKGGGCGDCNDCGVESESTGSWSWSLNIGETEFGSENNLLNYSQAGVLEGSVRGAPLRTFSEVFGDYNGGMSSKQQLMLAFEAKTITAAIADASNLSLGATNTAAKVIKDGATIRQVLTDSVLTDVSPLGSGAGFTVRMWTTLSTPAKSGGGLYALPSGSPFHTVTFSNPDHPADNHRIDKTTTENTGGSSRTITKRYEETYLPAPNDSVPDTFTITTYNGASASGPALRKEFIKYSNRGAGTTSGPASASGTRRYRDYDITRTISEATLSPASPAGVLGTLKDVSKTYEQYADFTLYTGTTEPDPGGGKGARRLISSTRGYLSAEPRTTTWTYYDQPSNPLIHGRLKSMTAPDRGWEYYEYSDSKNTSIAVETKWSSWKDVLLTNKANARKTVTEVERDRAKITTTINGQPVAKREVILETLPDDSLLTTSRDWDGTAWSNTVTCRHPQKGNALTTGRLKWEERPDGTATTYAYATVSGGYTVTTSSGAGDRNGITAGTRKVETRNAGHTTVLMESYDIQTNLLIDAWSKSNLDNKGRPQRTDYLLDDTYSLTQYSCCGVGSTQDRFGATSTYTRDPLKRVYRVVSKRSPDGPSLTTTTAYDGLTTTREITDGKTTLFLGSTTTNLAGETKKMESPDADDDDNLETTQIVTTYPTGGGKVVTTTLPDTKTSIRTTYADGQLASVSGTASVHGSFDYGTHILNGGGTWSQSIAANGTEWIKTYYDQLGRPIRTQYPGTDIYASNTYYPFDAGKGSRGQLKSATDPDEVTVSYTYDDEGDLYQTTEAIPDSQQRITLTVNDVVNDGDIGVSYRRRTTVNGILLSTSLRGTLGYATKTVTLSGTSTRVRSLPDPQNDVWSAGAWNITAVSENGVVTRSYYVDGLLKATVVFEKGDNPPDETPADITAVADDGFISGSSATHDDYGRILTRTDSRTGTTNMGDYLDTGAVTSITEPGSRTTEYTYDKMGRTTSVTLPNTTKTYTIYTARGEVEATWGSQTYPTFRSYDSQGRMRTLYTWRDDSSLDLSDGASTTELDDASSTTWNYSTSRGWLDNKRDDDGKGADYTYTDAGRLETRTWARTDTSSKRVKTTYSYDQGMLETVTYANDPASTPNLAYTYDAFGRAKTVTQGSSGNANTHTFTYNNETWDHDSDPETESVAYGDGLALHSETVSYNGGLNKTITRTYQDGTGGTVKLRPNGYSFADGSAIWTFDDAGRVSTVSDGSDTFTYGYEDDSYGLIKTITGPAHTVTNTWEPTRNVLDTKTNADTLGTPSVPSAFDYTVNAIGQRTKVEPIMDQAAPPVSISTYAVSWTWGYNAAGELVSADHGSDETANAADRFYEFDAIGNRDFVGTNAYTNSGGTQTQYGANSLNQYTGAAQNFEYDFDGNLEEGTMYADSLTSLTGTSYTATLKWDAENRLIEVLDGSTSKVSYAYDYLGRRISRSVGTTTTTTNYLYDGWNLIAEYTGSTAKKVYMWGMDLSGSMQGAGGVGGLISVSALDTGGTVIAAHYPAYDGNGNVTEYLKGTDGTAEVHFEYDPFGRLIANTDTAGDFPIRFSTKIQEDQTGLYYYGYRYYDPVTGRWPSRDPIGERGGVNLYGFVGNDGVNWIDRLGLKELMCPDCKDKNGNPVDCDELQRKIDKLDADYQDIKNQMAKVSEAIEKARRTSVLSFLSKVVPGAITAGGSLVGNAGKSTLVGVSTRPGYLPHAVSDGYNLAAVGSSHASRMMGASQSARNVGAGLVGAEGVGQAAAADGLGRVSDPLGDILAPLDKLFDEQMSAIDAEINQLSDLALKNRELIGEFQELFDRCCKDD